MKRFGLPPWLALSFPVLVGAVVMIACYAPVAGWGVHLAAGALGLSAYVLLTTVLTGVRWQPSRTVLTLLALIGSTAIASSLLAPGIDGMRRWHAFGPLLVHPSALLVPILLVFAAHQLGRHDLRCMFWSLACK